MGQKKSMNKPLRKGLKKFFMRFPTYRREQESVIRLLQIADTIHVRLDAFEMMTDTDRKDAAITVMNDLIRHLPELEAAIERVESEL
jgi:hypothetical protein